MIFKMIVFNLSLIHILAQARFIAETARMPFVTAEKPLFLPEPSEPAFEGMEAVPLLRSPLTEYLAERSIPYAVASRHCCRLNYGVRGKRYFAIGFPNVAGGYEIRSRYFKGCVPPVSYTHLFFGLSLPGAALFSFLGSFFVCSI